MHPELQWTPSALPQTKPHSLDGISQNMRSMRGIRNSAAQVTSFLEAVRRAARRAAARRASPGEAVPMAGLCAANAWGEFEFWECSFSTKEILVTLSSMLVKLTRKIRKWYDLIYKNALTQDSE